MNHRSHPTPNEIDRYGHTLTELGYKYHGNGRIKQIKGGKVLSYWATSCLQKRIIQIINQK